MAERPIFVHLAGGPPFVKEVLVSFNWNPGFALIQKQKNIEALHAAAENEGVVPVLEVSTKSNSPLGRELSAFNLKVPLGDGTLIPMECAFQGSKVFVDGGPYTDIYESSPTDAKKDERLRSASPLTGFDFEGQHFPLQPESVFYDWLYTRSLHFQGEAFSRLDEFAGFSDIEFNPKKSFSCQARSCALFVALRTRGIIGDVLASPEQFLRFMTSPAPELSKEGVNQGELF